MQEAISNGTIGKGSTAKGIRITFQRWLEADESKQVTIYVRDCQTGSDRATVHVPTAKLESGLEMGPTLELRAHKFGSKYELLPRSVHPTPCPDGDFFILPALGGTYDVNSSGVQGPTSVGGRLEPHSHSGQVDNNPSWRFGTQFDDSNVTYFETGRANTPKFLYDEVFEHFVYGVWPLRMKELSIEDFKKARHNFRKTLRGFRVLRSPSSHVPARHLDDGCGFHHEGAEPSAEGSVLRVDDDWVSRAIPNPGSDGHGEQTKEAECGTVSLLHDESYVLIHITRPGNRACTTNQRQHAYVPKVVPRKDELPHIAVQVTTYFRTDTFASVLCKRGTCV